MDWIVDAEGEIKLVPKDLIGRMSPAQLADPMIGDGYGYRVENGNLIKINISFNREPTLPEDEMPGGFGPETGGYVKDR